MTGLARACHPAPTVVVTAIAVLLGVGVALPVTTLALVGVTVLVGQLSIGWSNDWIDAAADARVGRRDKPTVRGEVSVTTLRASALTAVVVVVPLSLLAGWRAGAAHLVLVASGWIYNLGLKRTIWSPVPYLVGFGALPVYVVMVGEQEVSWWLPVSGALLGLAAHFANAAPDVEIDRETGVWGAPQRLGSRPAMVVALVALAGAGLVAMAQWSPAPAAWWLVVIAPPVLGLWLVARRAGRAVFVLVMAAAVMDVIALTTAL